MDLSAFSIFMSTRLLFYDYTHQAYKMLWHTYFGFWLHVSFKVQNIVLLVDPATSKD